MMNRRKNTILIFLSIIVLLGLVFYGGCVYGNLTAAEGKPPVEPAPELLKLEESFRDVSEHLFPSVVNINTEKIITTSYNQWNFDEDALKGTPFEDFFKYHFPQEESQQKATSLGSGVIVSSDGYILTNSHVINDADKINVVLNDGTVYDNVKLVGSDEGGDIAVLKIEGVKNLPAAVLGDSDKLQTGSWVLAVGNPYGFNSSLTSGIVSAMGRDFPVGNSSYGDFSDLIQTDAAINPGNSGGPLVNLYGEVVGINTAIITPTGGSVGLGFAIPINNAKFIMDQIIAHGSVVHGWLGVGLQELTPELSKNFGTDKGVIINQVLPGGPGENGGIQPGDVILKIDDEVIDKVSELQQIISRKSPGEKVRILALRNKENITLDVIVGTRPEDKDTVSITQEQPEGGNTSVSDEQHWKGLAVSNITDEISRKYNIEDQFGVIVTGVEEGSISYEAGFRGGEIIKKINDYNIKDINDYKNAIKLAGNGESLILVKSGNYTNFIIL